MAKHTYYFKHDFNSHNDEKIIDLRMSQGLEGYGAFWFLIELLASAENYILENNYKRLAFSMGTKEEVLKSVVEDFGLFSMDVDGKFWSDSLVDRMNRLDEIKLKRAEAGSKGGKSKANAKQLPSKEEAIAKQNQAEERREEESKGKNSKVKSNIEARELAFRESLNEFVSDYGKETVRAFFDYWTEPNKSGSKMLWETNKTWDLSRRMKRWANSSFNSPKVSNHTNTQGAPLKRLEMKDIAVNSDRDAKLLEQMNNNQTKKGSE